MKISLYDAGIQSIKTEIVSLVTKYNKRYKKEYGKDADQIPLRIIFKRGTITMSNGEWLKDPKLYDDLTLDPNKVATYFKRSNLNWGILGYGDPRDGIKGLMKFAKTKLNPKQLLGEGQDLKLEINSSNVGKLKGKEEIVARIIITVPDKGLGGKDIQSPILEKYGYLGLNKWQGEVKKLLGDTEIDRRLKDLLDKKVSLGDLISEKEKDLVNEEPETKEVANKEDVEKALLGLKFKKYEIAKVLPKLNMSKPTEEVVKEALLILGK